MTDLFSAQLRFASAGSRSQNLFSRTKFLRNKCGAAWGCFCLLAFFCLPANLNAQLDVNTKVGLGLSTFWVNGADPTREDFGNFGAGFNGAQTGIGLRSRFGLGPGNKHVLVLDGDYFLLRSAERIPFRSANLFVTHERDVLSLSLGYQFEFIEYNRVARMYAGAEWRATWAIGELYRQDLVKASNNESLQAFESDGKGDAMRMGPALRLGIIGQFQDEFFVDVSFAYTGLNMVGSEAERGPLFTHRDADDTAEENLIGAILFSLTVLYQF